MPVIHCAAKVLFLRYFYSHAEFDEKIFIFCPFCRIYTFFIGNAYNNSMNTLHFYKPRRTVCLRAGFLRAAATAVVCASTVLCFVSCENGTVPLFGGKEAVSIACPSWMYDEGAHNGSPQAYALYIDSGRGVQKIALTPNAFFAGGTNRHTLKVVLPKNRVTPFLFYRGETDAKPQGCVYPYDTCANVSGGFTAFVLYKVLLSAGQSEQSEENVFERASLFNWQKLAALMDSYEDPWILNDELMAQKIAEGKFSMRHIKKK